MCRPCHSAYHREHYLANKQRYVDQARVRKQVLRRERTAFLLDFFSKNPCVDCGETDPVVLEFDHLDAECKRFDIGNALSYRAWQSILEEIASARWSAPTAIGAEPPAAREACAS